MLALFALSTEARSSCVAGPELSLFGAVEIADAILVAQAGPAHHGHVGTSLDSQLTFEMSTVRVLKDATGRAPQRFYQLGWWSREKSEPATDFTVPRAYCETPRYRVGGKYLFFLTLRGDGVGRLTSARARLDAEIDGSSEPLIQAVERYLKIQRTPRERWTRALRGVSLEAREDGAMSPLLPDLERVLAHGGWSLSRAEIVSHYAWLSSQPFEGEPLGPRPARRWLAEGPLAGRLARVDALAASDPAEALQSLLGLPERTWELRADQLVARLRRDGMTADAGHLWGLPARHASWVTESLPELLQSADDLLGLPLDGSTVARWYARWDLPPPPALIDACRETEKKLTSHRTWCDSLLAESGDRDILMRADQWLREPGGLRRYGPRASNVFSVSPLPEAERALRSLLEETLSRLQELSSLQLPPGTEARRRRGFERLLKAWVWAQLDSPLRLATTRLVDFVAHLETVPFTACTVREVLEQRPEIEGAVLPLLDEQERSLLDACLLWEPPDRPYRQ